MRSSFDLSVHEIIESHHFSLPHSFLRKLWDLRTGDEMVTFAHSHVVRTAVLSKDEAKLYTGGQEKKLRIFDVERPKGDLSLFTLFCFLSG